jgi:hypothetical protein
MLLCVTDSKWYHPASIQIEHLSSSFLSLHHSHSNKSSLPEGLKPIDFDCRAELRLLMREHSCLLGVPTEEHRKLVVGMPMEKR